MTANATSAIDQAEGLGRTFYGVWAIPAPGGSQPLILTSATGGDRIEGSIDGKVVIAMSRPTAIAMALASKPVAIDGHEIAIYAETTDLGQTVRCDVFLDGYSLVTREPWSVIRGRAEAAKQAVLYASDHSGLFGTKLMAGASDGRKWVSVLSFVEVIALAMTAKSLTASALTGCVAMGNVGVLVVGQRAAASARGRGWSAAIVRAAEVAIWVVCLAAAAGLLGLGYVISRGALGD